MICSTNNESKYIQNMKTSINNIYFISGTMCDERIWTDVWKQLSPLIPADINFIHLVIPSLNTIDEITYDLSEKIAENSCIVGFSLGGYFASNIALMFPNKVKKLLLVSNMSSALPDKENKERLRTIQWINTHGYSGVPDKRINNLLSPYAHNNQHIKSIIQAMDKSLGKEVLVHQLKVTTQRKNLLPQLMALECPIQFCVGDTDCLVKLDRIQQHIAQSTTKNKILQVLENTGHMLPLEQPERLAHTIYTYFFEK